MKEFKLFDKVLVRDYLDDEWVISLFSHYNHINANNICVTINNFIWKYCIPYEGNEYLLGTTGLPKEEWKPKENELVAVRNCNTEKWYVKIFTNKTWEGFFHTSDGSEWAICRPFKEIFPDVIIS